MKTQEKVGYAAMKVDVVKAYDHVEWVFLERVMLIMVFDARWVQLIMTCVSSVRCTIRHNVRELGPIHPQQGLQQGIHYPHIYSLFALKLLVQLSEPVNMGGFLK